MWRTLLAAVSIVMTGCTPVARGLPRPPSRPSAAGAQLTREQVVALMIDDQRRLRAAVSPFEAGPKGYCSMTAGSSYEVQTFDGRGRVVASETESERDSYLYEPSGLRLIIDTTYKAPDVPPDRATVTFDAAGRRIHEERTHLGKRCSMSHEYDSTGCLAVARHSCGAHVFETRMSCDAAGRVIRVLDSSDGQTDLRYEVI